MNRKVAFKSKKKLFLRRDMIKASSTTRHMYTNDSIAPPTQSLSQTRVSFFKRIEKRTKKNSLHNKSLQISNRGGYYSFIII